MPHTVGDLVSIDANYRRGDLSEKRRQPMSRAPDSSGGGPK
jgi:hypothetical protein